MYKADRLCCSIVNLLSSISTIMVWADGFDWFGEDSSSCSVWLGYRQVLLCRVLCHERPLNLKELMGSLFGLPSFVKIVNLD
jgi:hypothetical protein